MNGRATLAGDDPTLESTLFVQSTIYQSIMQTKNYMIYISILKIIIDISVLISALSIPDMSLLILGIRRVWYSIHDLELTTFPIQWF